MSKLQKPENVSFDDIHGVAATKDTVLDMVDSMLHPEDGLSSNGLLLYGVRTRTKHTYMHQTSSTRQPHFPIPSGTGHWQNDVFKGPCKQ